MITSLRLNKEDEKLLTEIYNKMCENWNEIFNTKCEITRSEALRYCIRQTHYELVENESNKMDN